MKPTVNVLYLPGTNCHAETVRAFRRCGAEARLVFLSDILAGHARLDSADMLCIPGGFAYGDHVAAGLVAALFLREPLRAQFEACRRRPMLCICNGYQIAIRAGCFGSDVALVTNSCGTFRNVPDQVHHVVEGNDSLWLRGLSGASLTLPCAHGEGRFVYASERSWRPALRYPAESNPDGSMGNVAGTTTTDGLVFGLMNHPERALDSAGNLQLFENGVQAAR